MQLKEAKKDLTEEFKILEDGIFGRSRNLLLAAGYSEDRLNKLDRSKWFELAIEDEAKQIELEQIAEQHVELKAEFDKNSRTSVARSSRAMTWRRAYSRSSRSIWPSSVGSSRVTRWRVVTVTRVLSPRSVRSGYAP